MPPRAIISTLPLHSFLLALKHGSCGLWSDIVSSDPQYKGKCLVVGNTMTHRYSGGKDLILFQNLTSDFFKGSLDFLLEKLQGNNMNPFYLFFNYRLNSLLCPTFIHILSVASTGIRVQLSTLSLCVQSSEDFILLEVLCALWS
jgi:hypothetical protein